MFSMPYSRYLIYPIPWYSALIVTGAAIAIFLASREERRVGLPKDTVIDLALWILPFGILGARLYYVIFSWSSFSDDPVSVLRIWEGGLAIYGGILAGFAVILIFCRIRHISVPVVCDLIAPGLILAQAIGRWGNYFNMEAYGAPLTSPGLCFFPLAVQIPEPTGTVWHMATFFYESCWNLIVFAVLMTGRRRWFRHHGHVFGAYVFLYSCGRLVIEDLRTDSLLSSSVRVSQLLSICAVLAVLLLLFLTLPRRASVRGRAGTLLLPAAAVYGLWVAGYSLCLLPAPASLSGRILFLAGFSGISILAASLYYGSSAPEEVCYARPAAPRS